MSRYDMEVSISRMLKLEIDSGSDEFPHWWTHKAAWIRKVYMKICQLQEAGKLDELQEH